MKNDEILQSIDLFKNIEYRYKSQKIKIVSWKQISGNKIFLQLERGVLNFMLEEIPTFLKQLEVISQKPAFVPAVEKIIINETEPEEMQIFETKEYEKFGTILGNRVLNKTKIERIASDVKSGLNMLPFYPIIVSENDGKLMVIDGQHRLEVSKKTAMPVYYLLCKELTLKQIAQLNSRGEKWKPVDFLNCYINLGIQDYKKLREIVAEYKVGLKTAVTLLMHFGVNVPAGDDFQSGNFKCNHYEDTRILLNLVRGLFAESDFAMDRNLIKAVQTVRSKGICDFERLEQKIKVTGRMERMADYKKYLSILNEVYNHGNKNTVHIY